MPSRSEEIKARLRAAASVGARVHDSEPEEALAPEVEHDLDADERDPSRVAPSAEGAVTFAGLPDDVREWLATELEEIGHNGDGRRPQGADSPDDGEPH